MKQRLINAVIKNKDSLSYVNLDENNGYKGWTDDFNLHLSNGEKMRLNLFREEDQFLLFVLASSWSKTGPWENAAYYTTYLKDGNKSDIAMWLDPNFVTEEIHQCRRNAYSIVKSCQGISPRRKVSFRRDYYSSVVILAELWSKIKERLNEANRRSDYYIFIDYISRVNGLGAGSNRMKIKIPLILRELRCQGVYDNIPGKLCCVPDERVKNAAKTIGISLPHINSTDSLFAASSIIYRHFGDLYDIPLFAYEDVKNDINMQ